MGKNCTIRLFWVFFVLSYFCQPVLILCFWRMSVSMVFYGISLNTSNMNGNKYLNCFFSALIDIIAYLAAWLFANRVTRPTLLFCAMMLSGVMLMVIQLIPEGVGSLYNLPSTKMTLPVLCDDSCCFFPQTCRSWCKCSRWVERLASLLHSASFMCFSLSFFPLWWGIWASGLSQQLHTWAASYVHSSSIPASIVLLCIVWLIQKASSLYTAIGHAKS